MDAMKSLECKICGKVLNCEAGLARHMTVKHGGAKPQDLDPDPADDQDEQPQTPAANPVNLKPIVEEQADAAIAIATEICAALGLQRIDGQERRFFVNGANGKAVELTDDGHVYAAELRRKLA
jgi:hypothetical protein